MYLKHLLVSIVVKCLKPLCVCVGGTQYIYCAINILLEVTSLLVSMPGNVWSGVTHIHSVKSLTYKMFP